MRNRAEQSAGQITGQTAGQTAEPLDFQAKLSASTQIAVIAEIKRKSPSKGDLRPNLDPAKLAADYARGGAAALSVLTDEEFFGGSANDLAKARAAVDLPVLRKDFTVSEKDVLDARIMGADAVLLIVAALSPPELKQFSQLANELGLAALVEVHDQAELELALAAEAKLVGVNQRDLMTFQVDPERALRLGAEMPADVTSVAESGIRNAADVRSLAEGGYDAVLVGETLLTSDDPFTELTKLISPTNLPSTDVH